MPAEAWERFTINEDAKGPITVDSAFVREVSNRDHRPGQEVWVIFRRNAGDPTETGSCEDCQNPSGASGGFAPASRGRDRRRQKRTGDGPLRAPHMSWLASSYDADLPGALFLARLQLKMKKSPALTPSQSKALIQKVLGPPEFDFKLALEIIIYQQERNYAATAPIANARPSYRYERAESLNDSTFAVTLGELKTNELSRSRKTFQLDCLDRKLSETRFDSNKIQLMLLMVIVPNRLVNLSLH
jgi:hypothetical protein